MKRKEKQGNKWSLTDHTTTVTTSKQPEQICGRKCNETLLHLLFKMWRKKVFLSCLINIYVNH